MLKESEASCTEPEPEPEQVCTTVARIKQTAHKSTTGETPRKMDSRMLDVWEKLLDAGREYDCSQMTKLRCQFAVDVSLPPLYWRPKYHLRFPPDFQRMVFTFMVCNRRRRWGLPWLPMEVIWCVLEMLDYTTLGAPKRGWRWVL